MFSAVSKLKRVLWCLGSEQPEVSTAALDTLNEEIGLSVYDIADQLSISLDIIAQLIGYDLNKCITNSNVVSKLRK
jgi:hypothetical protein